MLYWDILRQHPRIFLKADFHAGMRTIKLRDKKRPIWVFLP